MIETRRKIFFNHRQLKIKDFYGNTKAKILLRRNDPRLQLPVMIVISFNDPQDVNYITMFICFMYPIRPSRSISV